MTHMGNSIVGDDKYKKKFKKIKNIDKDLEKLLMNLNRQFLHAKVLGFIHPRKKKEMISTLGDDLIESLISSNSAQASRDKEIMTAVFGEDSASEEETDESPMAQPIEDEIADMSISETRDDNEVDGNIEQEDVVEFEWDGKKYFKDQDDDLFDPTTGEHIGQYDAEEAIVELFAA